MYKYFFFIIAIIIGINSSCSNHNKPKDVSLVTQMEAVPKNDLPQFIDSIADGILNVVNPKAYSIFLESIKKQLVNDDAELRISLIYLEAEIERIQGNNNRALKKLLESLPYFEKSDGETTKIKILNLIGYLFQQKSTDFQSFDSYLKTFSNQERPEKLKELALLSRYLSAHYLKKEDSIKSIKYAKREVAIYTELNDFQSIRDAKIKLAEYFQKLNNHSKTIELLNEILNEGVHLDSIETYIQWSLGKSLYANSDYKKALEAFQKVNQTENRPVIYSDINMLIGDTEFNIKNWQKSKSYYQKQLELKNNSKTTITQCKLKIAQIENITGNKQRAITLLKKISENPKDEDIELKATAAFELSKILAILNKHEESNIYLNKYITLQKSVSLTATKNLISTLEKRQNNVEKEQRIELLYKDSEIQTTLYNKENENNRILLIGIFLISLLLIITLWLFISGIKKNQQLSIKNFEIQEKNEELNTMNSELHMINKQLIESEEKLMKEINAQDKLLSIVAHDLKSPLVALKSILGLYRMSKTKFTPENMEIAINRVENELGSVLELLNNLLSWALNHRGNMHINLNTSNVSEIIENTIALFGEQSSIKNITLNKSIIPNLQWTVDSNMLQFIVRNFITNAIKFTPDKGRITISTTAENNILFISVKDTGIGLNPEQLKNLSRFTEITPAKGTRGERGSGIGLILCNEFAQKLNGKLNIVSQPGKGSTFSLLLYQ